MQFSNKSYHMLISPLPLYIDESSVDSVQLGTKNHAFFAAFFRTSQNIGSKNTSGKFLLDSLEI